MLWLKDGRKKKRESFLKCLIAIKISRQSFMSKTRSWDVDVVILLDLHV